MTGTLQRREVLLSTDKLKHGDGVPLTLTPTVIVGSLVVNPDPTHKTHNTDSDKMSWESADGAFPQPYSREKNRCGDRRADLEL